MKTSYVCQNQTIFIAFCAKFLIYAAANKKMQLTYILLSLIHLLTSKKYAVQSGAPFGIEMKLFLAATVVSPLLKFKTEISRSFALVQKNLIAKKELLRCPMLIS